MSWVVADMVRRARLELGEFRRCEWRQFLKACGLTYGFDYLPGDCRAVIDGDEVVFRHDVDEEEAADAAYHEGWHLFANVGDVRWWMRCAPQGPLTVAKWEYRAECFARMYPIDGVESDRRSSLYVSDLRIAKSETQGGMSFVACDGSET